MRILATVFFDTTYIFFVIYLFFFSSSQARCIHDQRKGFWGGVVPRWTGQSREAGGKMWREEFNLSPLHLVCSWTSAAPAGWWGWQCWLILNTQTNKHTHTHTHNHAELELQILAEKDLKCVFSSDYKCLLLMRDVCTKRWNKRHKESSNRKCNSRSINWK